jgi:dTDP-4-amino-4,6-dideoxygalactose transaminase
LRVERYDYAAQFGDDIDAVVDAIRAILLRGEYDKSPETRRFEEAYAAFAGTRFARAVGCGTDALILVFRALGIGPGDEVITQANTFYATAAAIAVTGARPVLVDPDPATFLMDQERLEAAITPRTKAIVPVHLYGKPTPMRWLLDLARSRGIAVVEDAAQAHGASIDGRTVGTFGIAGCFSFHPSKNLAAAGDAGCVVTDDAGLARAIEAYRTHGQVVQHHHEVLGLNTKMDALQATVLLSKLPKLTEWTRRRGELAARYRALLADLPISFQRADPGETHAYHLFVVRTPQRDELLEHLQRCEIDAVVRYPVPIHLQPAFSSYGWRKGDFPVAERLAAELLCLPLRPEMTQAQQAYVVDAVRAFAAAAV